MTQKIKFHPHMALFTILVSGLLFSVSVHAEPGVSTSFRPYVWTFAVLLPVLLSWLVVRFLVKSGNLESSLKRWITGIILLILFLVTISPSIAIILSIMITGRTM